MTTPQPVHLVVGLNGLWGHPKHIEYLGESVVKHSARPEAPPSETAPASPSAQPMKVVVLLAKSNAVDWTYGYDSIEVCADRVVDEIDAEVERIKQDGGRVERFSMVGYSLGGLISRFAIGILDSRQPSFFDEITPVNFATFASPAIGIPQYRTFWSSVFRFLGARLLSRTGEQLYEKDRFLPTSFHNPDAGENSGKSGRKSGLARLLPFVPRGKEPAEPLLKIMADPRYSFYKALSKFERIEVFANTVNDRTVPFVTGAFEAHDPFALARAKAQKIAEERGEDPATVTDVREGGLDITLRSDAPIVETYAYITPPPPSPSKQPKSTLLSRLTRKLPRVPMLLRPSSFPVARWKGWIVVLTLPLTLPCVFCFLVVRFSLQGRASRKRIRAARKARGEGRDGMLQRVGVRIAEVVEEAGVENPEYAGGLDSPQGREGARSAATSGTATPVGSNSANGAADSKTALLSPSSSASSNTTSSSIPSSATLPSRRSSPFPPPSSEDLHTAHRLKTDPLLSDSQRFQLENLNALPQLRKHFVWLPQVRHTHGAIVRRDPNFYYAKEGKKVVDSWAREFRV
ncbi:hypothetical protein JCM10213_000018 [Rhodosporidiobolus nylandii]